jgi:hypothetical protein
MSMSTQQGGGSSRRQSAVSTGSPGKKSAKSSPSAPAKSEAAAKGGGAAKNGGPGATRNAASRPGAKNGGPRRPVAPVKVRQDRNWGPIALFAAVGVLAVAIIGFGGWYVYKGTLTWEDKAGAISGIVNYRKTNPAILRYEKHEDTPLTYPVSPAVGGAHNNAWQRCMGDVYEAPIATEHAVHSMEHGAVWVTYRPDLPKDQVDKLAAKVRGNDFTLMSPFPGLDKAISLQAWGYQLKVDNASDKRIDQFIRALRQNASMEQGAVCSGGNYVTATGTTPRDMSQQQPPQQPGAGSGVGTGG